MGILSDISICSDGWIQFLVWLDQSQMPQLVISYLKELILLVCIIPLNKKMSFVWIIFL